MPTTSFDTRRILRSVTQITFALLCAMMVLSAPIVRAQVETPPVDATTTEWDEWQTSAEEFGSIFAGTWGVYLAPRGVVDGGDHGPWSGRAEVNNVGGVTLRLTARDGTEERFHSIEIIAALGADIAPGQPDAPSKHFTIQFEKTIDDGNSADSPVSAVSIPLPQKFSEIKFKLLGDDKTGEPVDLRLPVVWDDRRRLRIRVNSASENNRHEASWDQSETKLLENGGYAVWRNSTVEIDDVIVVDNQMALRYPFNLDGTEIKNRPVTTRLLIVHGENLQRLASMNVTVKSAVDEISYKFDPNGVASNHPALMATRAVVDGALALGKSAKNPNSGFITALEKRRDALADVENLFFIEVTLSPGVTPGTQQFSLENTNGKWPLLFGNQGGTLQFARHDDQARTEPTTTFYPGDIGAVDLVFEIEMPFDSIGIRLMRRPAEGVADENAERDKAGHILLATRLNDIQAQEKPVYRTEPIHFLSRAQPEFAPPADPEAFVFYVNDGDTLGAGLFDPSRAIVTPSIAMAKIDAVSEELGELWKSALTRVAKCDGDTFNGDPLYALKRSTQFSEIVIGELVRYVSPIAFIAAELSDADKTSLDFNPTVDVYKGDHAAAILIRNELVGLMADASIVVPIAALADNANGEIQALRARAIKNGPQSEPLIQHGSAIWIRKPFWRQPTFGKAMKALFGAKQGAATSMKDGPLSTVTLTESLDIKWLATRFDVTEAEAEKWAIKATQGAAKRQLTNLEKAIGRAQDAGDCNLEELLVVAGQKSDPAVARIVPQLVKKITLPGPPKRTYWKADRLARGYVERLHMAGKAVRALDQYSTIDDAYKAMGLAVLTAGAAFAATAALSGGAAIGAGLLIGGDVADMAYFGAKGLERSIESQEFYDYARGASLVLGDEILIEAEAQRESVEMALIGLIAPGIGAGIGLKDLRHFKNINKGKALIKTKGVGILDNLDELPPTERVQLAAYYSDLITKIERSGLAGLDESDRTAIGALSDLKDRYATVAPPGTAAQDPFTITPRPLSPEADPKGPFIGVDEFLGPEFKHALASDESALTRPWRPGDSIYDSVRTAAKSENGSFVLTKTNKYGISDAEDIRFSDQPLGQGSFNTAFAIDDDLVARIPGGKSGKPSGLEKAADKGGRNVFENANVDEGTIRLVELKKTVKVDEATLIPVSGAGNRPIRLDPGEEIEVVENFKPGSLKSNMRNRPAKRMTVEEAIAYDKGVRELNKKGLVALDLKYDNFGFEPVSPGSKQLRLVIMDPGGIVPMKSGGSGTARRVQALIDGGELKGITAWKKVQIMEEFGDSFDVKALNLTDPYQIPFNPIGVSEFPRGRELSTLNPEQAAAYYQALRAAGR